MGEMNVTILSDGLGRYKSRAFLLPVLKYRSEIEDNGIDLSITGGYDELDRDCDCLIVEDNVFTRNFDMDDALPQIAALADRVDRLLWFDTADSTGEAIMPRVIPIVDKYYKKQLLNDRERYCEPLWSGRVHTEYYHTNYDIEATGNPDDIFNAKQVESSSDLDKLGVYWNLGLGLYFPFFNQGWLDRLQKLPDALTYHFPWTVIEMVQRAPGMWASPTTTREVPVSARFSTDYDMSAISHHRRLMQESLTEPVDTEWLTTIDYWRELRNTKVLLSPFGHGAICHRDFEGFLSGCLLIKPDMEFLETWPPLYDDGETMLAVDWDMSDVNQTVNWALDHPGERREIAQTAQQRYRRYLFGESARIRFVDRFLSIVRG